MSGLGHVLPTHVTRAAAVLEEHYGLVLLPGRLDALATALAASAARADPPGIDAVVNSLERDAALRDALAASVAVGETHFLRHAEQCALIRDRLLPEAAARVAGSRKLRIWSAGCATGEEAYTLAILCIEAGLGDAAWIVGTDISQAALACARRPTYAQWSLRGVPDDVSVRYFEQHGSRWRPVPAVRRIVEFRPHNLADATDPFWETAREQMDIIVCRNVLIYFTADRARRVADRFHDSLVRGGRLLLGPSDPLCDGETGWQIEVTNAGLTYTRAGRPAARKAGVRTVSTTGASPAAPAARGDRRERARAVPVAQPVPPQSAPRPGTPQPVAAHVNGEAALHCLAGMALLDAGRVTAAVSTARRATCLDAECAMGYVVLGEALLRLGDDAAAGRALDNVVRTLEGQTDAALVAGSDGVTVGTLRAWAEARRARAGSAVR